MRRRVEDCVEYMYHSLLEPLARFAVVHTYLIIELSSPTLRELQTRLSRAATEARPLGMMHR